MTEPEHPRRPWRDVAATFLRLGVTSYGDPAIMGIMQAELQEKRAWVSRSSASWPWSRRSRRPSGSLPSWCWRGPRASSSSIPKLANRRYRVGGGLSPRATRRLEGLIMAGLDPEILHLEWVGGPRPQILQDRRRLPLPRDGAP